ncbi:FXYD domain-containing ion transport regulator 11 [Lates japonicus]|uniref:FXYD domain-containing ion transport regulator n=1 Tax=Lates japonicus TaxID=270547 RepID=A0AAD3M893_LATJO|nr:FXYD domain-containing ion transport regulator 11 [Lates japonicus]
MERGALGGYLGYLTEEKEQENKAALWNIHTHSSAPESISSVVLKMGHLTLVAVMAVLFTLFVETEANPFVYNYERLRIGGLVFACLLVVGGISILLYNRCTGRNKKAEDDNIVKAGCWRTVWRKVAALNHVSVCVGEISSFLSPLNRTCLR